MRSSMKTISCLLFSLLVACGGGAKQTPTNTTTSSSSSTGDGQPCTQEIILNCPDGQIDACVKAMAKTEQDKPDDGTEESGGTGTAMALDEGKMGKADAAGTHKCVPK
jgi:hypothetical protein